MAYWLVKSEADVYSIDRFRKEKSTPWDGVRNYQARNFLREMRRGDKVLFYHSNSDPLAVVGVAAVQKEAFPDALQYDRTSDYYDPGATLDNPRWFSPQLRFVEKFSQPVTLERLKRCVDLKSMVLLKRGSRLSVQPVSEKEFKAIIELAKNAEV